MFSIREYFAGYPAQFAVANMMLTHGIRLVGDKPYIGEIQQSDSAMARAIGVDRRVVRQTIDTILCNPELEELYTKLGCTSDISGSASVMGCSAMKIIPVDDACPGMLAKIMNILYELGANIRQALVVRNGDGTPTHLVVTMDGGVPGTAVKRIYAIGGIAEVIILRPCGYIYNIRAKYRGTS